MMVTKRVRLTMPESDYEYLFLRAQSQGIGIGTFVERVLCEWLQRQEGSEEANG